MCFYYTQKTQAFRGAQHHCCDICFSWDPYVTIRHETWRQIIFCNLEKLIQTTSNVGRKVLGSYDGHLQNYNFSQSPVPELIVPLKSHYKSCTHTHTETDRDVYHYSIYVDIYSTYTVLSRRIFSLVSL